MTISLVLMNQTVPQPDQCPSQEIVFDRINKINRIPRGHVWKTPKHGERVTKLPSLLPSRRWRRSLRNALKEFRGIL